MGHIDSGNRELPIFNTSSTDNHIGIQLPDEVDSRFRVKHCVDPVTLYCCLIIWDERLKCNFVERFFGVMDLAARTC